MYKRFLLLIMVGLSVGDIAAQQPRSVSAKAISVVNTDQGKMYYGNTNEAPRAVEFNDGTVSASSFLANINKFLNIPSAFTFTEIESTTDNLGMRHHVLQQYYQGIPLEGMTYRVHEKNGFVTSANGKGVRTIKLDTRLVLNETQAFNMAVKHLNTKDNAKMPGKKVIVSKDFTFSPESFSIAFQFDIDVSFAEAWRISIDARTGNVINKVSLVNHCFEDKKPPLPYTTGTGLTNYYGRQTVQVEKLDDSDGSRLVGQTEHGGKIETYNFNNQDLWTFTWAMESAYISNFTSNDNTFDYVPARPAVSVQWAAEKAYEYYFNHYGRNSFDNNGAAIKSYVHVDVRYDNAFWSNYRHVLAFGDGSNNNPLVELDVVGHELTHGVTQYEASLYYAYESGALNESFSDILGKAIEFNTFGDTATWQIARHFINGGIRDFSNPNLKNQPDTYEGDYWYTGYDDYGGVHYNSGVQNFWFYLLCNGGSGINDHNFAYSINPIGIEAAANIAYRNLTEYLGPLSDYLDSRLGSMLATVDLYGKNSSAYREVNKAWDAVGVIDEPSVTSLQVYDITGTTAKIKGTLIPRGDTVVYHFEYGKTPALGTSSSTYHYIDKIDGIVSGLQPKTKYYLKLVVSNEHGSTNYDTDFTTVSLDPMADLKQAIDVTETTATLRAEINPNSLYTSYHFEYGVTPSFGSVTPTQTLADTTEFLPVSAIITNLQPRQTYYYRLVATNSSASVTTSSMYFFTASKPVIHSFSPAAASIDTEVIIVGQNFNPTSDNNIVTFGATRAKVQSATPTEIKVRVPAGASLGTISVLDAESGLVAESVAEFVPTYTGTFQPNSLQLRVGFNDEVVYETAIADMDGDGRPDIVARSNTGFSIYQNINNGGDLTEDSFVRNSYAVNIGYHLTLADVDGNGFKDIVGYTTEGLLIYPNFSQPGFIYFGAPTTIPLGSMMDFMLGDFDQDGRIDIVTATYVSNDTTMITVFRNQNQKGVIAAADFQNQFSKPVPQIVYHVTSDDMNNDGKPDIILAVLNKSFVPVLQNNSTLGVLDFSEIIIDDFTRGASVEYISQDFNQDGWKDIASYPDDYYQPGTIAVLKNNATATISMNQPAVALANTIEHTMQSADMDGNGKPDLLASTDARQFTLLRNNTEAASDFSFENFRQYGLPTSTFNTGFILPTMSVNDLNGDGRPEVINTYSYYYFPRDGYIMEIWQNSPDDCLDPSLIKVKPSNYSAEIVLPPNTTFDQFTIELSYDGYWWSQLSSTTMYYLSPGVHYKLRARTKCYLGFTDYAYIEFTTDCANLSSFNINYIGIDYVNLDADDINAIEIQYSLSGENQWQPVAQYTNQIQDLAPGTSYDLRYRGRCNSSGEYVTKTFTTICPTLSSLSIVELTYNKARISWASSYSAPVSFEYSTDNTTWISFEGDRLSPLVPAQLYSVRGALQCANSKSNFIYQSFYTPCANVLRVDVDDVTPISASIHWTDDSNASSFIVKYSPVDQGPVMVEVSSLSYDMHDLHPGTSYAVSVAPQCSSTKNFRTATFMTPCYAPLNLSVDNITYTTAELSWEDNFNGSPYTVDYSIVGTDHWLTTTTTSTSLQLANLRPGERYQVRVHINCLSVDAPYASRGFETELYDETSFFPNPTTGDVTIHPSKNLIGNHFSLYNNVGNLVVDGALLDYTVHLSNFSPGVYTLKIEGEKLMRIVKY